MCWEAWNGLITTGTPTGISTANGFECDMEVCDFDVTEGWGVFGSLTYDVCKVFGPLVLIELPSIAKYDSHFLRIWNLEWKSEMRKNMYCNVLVSINQLQMTSIYSRGSLFCKE